MSIRYYTGSSGKSFDNEVAQGRPLISNPMQEAQPNHYVINQVYMQRWAYYTRPPTNFRCPADIHSSTAYFCEDSERIPTGQADIVTWTRTWATKPSQVVDYDTAAIAMPARGAAFRFDIGSAGAPFEWYPYLAAKGYNLPRRVTILYDFYLIGIDDIPNGINCDHTSPSSIPSDNETIYTGRDVTSAGTGPLSDDQYTGMTAQNVGLFSGAVLDPGGNTSGTGNTTYVASQLSAGNYWIGQSLISRYMGNIWRRRSTRITL